MKLCCIGCGPGDPELITVKAVKILKEADVVFAPTSKQDKPSIALSIIKDYLFESKTKVVNLIFPMIKDRKSLEEHWRINADKIAKEVRKGKKVVYVTVGDPSLYSTWIYIHNELKNRYKEIEIEIVPGITSIFAFAAEAKMSLVEGDENLGIVPACYDINKVRQTAIACDTIVFLKDGRYFGSVIEMLKNLGFSKDSTLAIAEEVTTDNNTMSLYKLDEFQLENMEQQKYFSIMVVKKNAKQ